MNTTYKRPRRKNANECFIEDAPAKDKSYRKYAQGVDKALVLFETALEEWADYISFLNRLLKVGTIHLHCRKCISLLT